MEVTGSEQDKARQYMGAVISAPALKVGKTYTVYVGGVQQAYAAAGELGGFGGFGPGGFGGFSGTPDGNFDPSRMGGFDPSQQGQGNFDPSQMGNFNPGQNGQSRPEMPSGQGGFDPSQMGNFDPNTAFGGNTSGELYPDFVLEDTVNGFSGVSDYVPSAE